MKNKKNDGNKSKSLFPPSNISVNYYTDPIYSSDAFYGYDEKEASPEEDPQKKAPEEVPEERIESWGWVNNVD